MQKVDRLGWASGLSYRAYGWKVGIRFNTPEVPAEVEDCLPPGCERTADELVDMLFSVRLGGKTADGRGFNYHLLYRGNTRDMRTKDRGEVFLGLEYANHGHLAQHARDRVFVHAGAVAYGGQAILLPGRSTAGKSTLVVALLKAGAELCSDEFAVLDARGNLYPFPRRVSLGSDPERKDRIHPADLGATVAREPVPVALVALAQYRPGATWQPRRLSSGAGAQALMSQTVSIDSFNHVGVPAYRNIVQRATVWKGFRGEADETAARLLRMLE